MIFFNHHSYPLPMITYQKILYTVLSISSSSQYCLQCINVVHPTIDKLYEERTNIHQ